MLPPVETEPAYVTRDGFDILDLFLARVRVIEPEVTSAVVIPGYAEIETDCLGVTDMQVTVRFGREAGTDSSVVGSVRVVPVDDVANKIRCRGVRISFSDSLLFIFRAPWYTSSG